MLSSVWNTTLAAANPERGAVLELMQMQAAGHIRIEAGHD